MGRANRRVYVNRHDDSSQTLSVSYLSSDQHINTWITELVCQRGCSVPLDHICAKCVAHGLGISWVKYWRIHRAFGPIKYALDLSRSRPRHYVYRFSIGTVR